MPIAVGSRLPDVTFKVKKGDITTDMTTADVFAGKKVVLFAVPGAYTPTCSLKHLPGFLNNIDAFKKHGIDTVACTSVNDHHVLAAWGKDTGADGRILLLADGSGAFAKAIGLSSDSAAMGLRSQRYAAYVEDGVLKILNLEQPGQFEASSAETMLKMLPG
jgi:glutaredoxin/glutathione-dependent peroxiredoxin